MLCSAGRLETAILHSEVETAMLHSVGNTAMFCSAEETANMFRSSGGLLCSTLHWILSHSSL